MQIAIIITFGIAVRTLVLLFDKNLFNTVFACPNPSQMTILWYSHEILRTIVAHGDSTPSAMVLPIEQIECVLANKASFDFTGCPDRTLANFQQLDPFSKGFTAVFCLRLFSLNLGWYVELASLLPVLACWILYLDPEVKLLFVNFNETLLPEQNKFVTGCLCQ